MGGFVGTCMIRGGSGVMETVGQVDGLGLVG